jgi:hypothetical protein
MAYAVPLVVGRCGDGPSSILRGAALLERLGSADEDITALRNADVVSRRPQFCLPGGWKMPAIKLLIRLLLDPPSVMTPKSWTGTIVTKDRPKSIQLSRGSSVVSQSADTVENKLTAEDISEVVDRQHG